MAASLQLELCVVVVVFAAIQSVFGVGLLVFGTPTLLLLGLPFEQVLAYLLPCSIVISALQVQSGGGLTLEPIRRRLLLWTVPGVLAGTVLVLTMGTSLHVKSIVGAMLVLTAAARALGPAREAVGGFVRRQLTPALAVLGVLHGLSNLGGGVLAFIVGSVFTEKRDIRKHVAFGYGLMAVVQVITLFATTSVRLRPALWLTLPALAGLTFAAVGQRLFAAAGQRTYQWGLTLLLLLFGVALVATA